MQTTLLGRQPNEILDLILSEVCRQSIRDLSNICLVSRELYGLAVPHLYRKTCVDFRRASHLCLLRRLERPGSRIPGMIRHLHLASWEPKHIELPENRNRIENLFNGLVNLEELEWEGPFDVSAFVLDALLMRFPRTRVSIKSKQLAYGDTTTSMSLRREPENSIHQRAISTITCLEINLSEYTSWPWTGFRHELMGIVIRNPALKVLKVVADSIGEVDYTTLTEIIKEHTLPKLRDFRLFVSDSSIFTEDELQVWGEQGGWEELVSLGLNDPKSLIPFIGKTPILEKLCLIPRDGENTEALESHLANSKESCPFPALEHLKIRSPWSGFATTQHNYRAVPWNLLNLLPLGQLKSLDISRPCGGIRDTPDVPQAEDISKIRNMCSKLNELSLDMAIPMVQGQWPSDVIKELTAFTEPITLTIFMHCGFEGDFEPDTPVEILLFCRYFYRISIKIGPYFLKKRESQRVPGNPPFQVNLAYAWGGYCITEGDEITQPYESLFRIQSVEVREGVSRVHRQFPFLCSNHLSDKDLERMSLEKLTKKTKLRFLNILCGRTRYRREIERRKNFYGDEAGGCGTELILYDILMLSESDRNGT